MNPHVLGIEPVPEVTQLALLSFLAGLVGFINSSNIDQNFKVTAHRVIVHANKAYLQQACGYLSADGYQSDSAGRIFPGSHGITGKALADHKTWRTRRYSELADLESDLGLDMIDLAIDQDIGALSRSWLAIPLANKDDQVVLVIFAESKTMNFFADDSLVETIQCMTKAFGNLIAQLEANPMERVRNFSSPREEFVTGDATVFKRIQEAFPSTPATDMGAGSFNFECSPA